MISRRGDRTPWQIFESLAIGDHTLSVSVALPLATVKARIEALSQPQHQDTAEPALVTSVADKSVEAHYALAPNATANGPEWFDVIVRVRPVFRGTLEERLGDVQLSGWYGVNTLTRLLGVLSPFALVTVVLGDLFRLPLGYANLVWVVPVALLVLCLLTRANNDDIEYMSRNLEYALSQEGTI